MEGKEFQRFEQLETRVNKVKIQKTELTKKKMQVQRSDHSALCKGLYYAAPVITGNVEGIRVRQ